MYYPYFQNYEKITNYSRSYLKVIQKNFVAIQKIDQKLDKKLF